MDFYELVDQVAALLEQRGKLTYRSLRRQFDLDDEALDDLKGELLFSHPVVDENGRGLVWMGDSESAQPSTSPLSTEPEQVPLSFTPSHLAEKILTSRSALEGERKQVTVLFADIKDSTEVIRDFDPKAVPKTHPSFLGHFVS